MSESKTWYVCDPQKNTDCRKRMCWIQGGPCFRTSKTEFAEKDIHGKPIGWTEKEIAKPGQRGTGTWD